MAICLHVLYFFGGGGEAVLEGVPSSSRNGGTEGMAVEFTAV